MQHLTSMWAGNSPGSDFKTFKFRKPNQRLLLKVSNIINYFNRTASNKYFLWISMLCKPINISKQNVSVEITSFS